MRVFIAVLVLIFSLQSLTKADDIRDFQIEGMSIGDSLLDYFNKSQIEKSKNSKDTYKYKKGKFIIIDVGNISSSYYLKKKFEVYEKLHITIKSDDKNYIVEGLGGLFLCEVNIQNCFSKKKEIVSDLKGYFKNMKIYEKNKSHRGDKSKESKVYSTYFKFKERRTANIGVQIYDWSDKRNKNDFQDSVKVSVHSDEYNNFIINEAYKDSSL